MQKHFLILITFLLLLSNFSPLFAQNKDKDKERLKNAQNTDKNIQACITSKKHAPEELPAEFSTYEWAKNLQKLVGEVLYEENADVLIEIADEEETTRALYKFSKHCKSLGKVSKELGKLVEIYDEAIKDRSHERHNPNTGFSSTRKVTFKASQARKMKAQINSIVNRMEGDNSIFRKLR